MRFIREFINDFPLYNEDKKVVNNKIKTSCGKNMINISSRSAWLRIVSRRDSAEQTRYLTK